MVSVLLLQPACTRETNLGEHNSEIGFSNSVAANLWYQLRQAYGHIHNNDYFFASINTNSQK